jgi:hypothetical protein
MKTFTLNRRSRRRDLWRTRHWRSAGAALIALTVIGAALLTGSTGMLHHTAARHTVGIRLADSASNSGQCVPGAQSPVITGGVATLNDPCISAPGSPALPGATGQQGAGQQGQQCQLTDAQQQELIARAQDQQATSDQAFQALLLKNLLALAATKAAGAALTAQLSGHVGLSPQDVASLIQNGSVTPADMASAILQTLQGLGESSGDVVIDLCADGGATAASDPRYSASDDGATPANDQQLAAVEQQSDQEGWASLPPTELGQKIAEAINKWASGRTAAICDLVTRAHLSQQAAAVAANEAADGLGGAGAIVQMGDSLVAVANAGPETQMPAMAIAPDGTVTPAWVNRTFDPSIHDFVYSNLRPRT